ncbi:MAG: ATP-dependent 6-phosphofructokinase [Candidatus Izemoplasmatales bacterium]|nr:ATP-dependent 6-phosphofructokinase [Candidatus Izemoplasmatales bacterium]MDD3865840.1 ATP-dependent 6-phosphofructokinase [Candidatus Izemoplasmatales bacterium]
MSDKIKKIAILTGGGDCCGINGAIRSIVRTAIVKYHYEVVGFIGGYSGLYSDEYIPMTLKTVSGIFHQGGTILKNSNRDNLFSYRVKDENGCYVKTDVSDVAIVNLKKHEIDAIIIIGGDGTLTSARDFARKGVNVIGVPKTIDNDVPGTDITFGYRTALDHIVNALDALHTTAYSHNRVMILEVMGRNAGWLTLEGGIAGSADAILIPEIPYDIHKIAKKIIDRYNSGSQFSILCVSEGSRPVDGDVTVKKIVDGSPDTVRLGGAGEQVARALEMIVSPITGQELRSTTLGYIQRGGVTNCYDRILSTRYGSYAVDLIDKGLFGNMVAIRDNKMTYIPIEEVVGTGLIGETSLGGKHLVDPEGDLVTAAKGIGIVFGD